MGSLEERRERIRSILNFLFKNVSCSVDGTESMFKMGIFLNDYGEADCNKEMIMASMQKSDTLKQLLLEEQNRSRVK